MNSTIKLGAGVVAACAACCAVSILPAVLAGTGLAALGAAAFSWGGIATAVAAIAVAGAAYFGLRVRPRAATAKPLAIEVLRAQGCGCGTSDRASDAAIACMLEAEDFKTRTQAIRDLAQRSLREASRGPLSLTLSYDIAAAAEVRALVAQERECCPFLTFGVREKGDVIEVAILAPAAAAEAADALFDHFAPELASKMELA